MGKETNQTEKETSSPNAVRTSSVGWMLKRLSISLDDEMNRKLKPLGINLAQFAILMTLLETDGLTQVEIGKKISMPGYATTRNVDVLEAASLVQRQPHETSRRSLRVHLTAEGKALAPRLFSIVQEVNASLLMPLKETEVGQLQNLLGKLIQAHGMGE